MWEAVETAAGVYNETYLSEIDSLIRKLGAKGIYTLVDAHQDVLTRLICGEGMPAFYAKEIIDGGAYCLGKYEDKLFSPLFNMLGFCKSIASYHFDKDSNGFPLIQECQERNFFEYYTSPESLTLFRAFYKNNFGLQDKYVAYWTKVASFFAPNEFVVGFDPMNEPFPTQKGLADLLFQQIPGEFDRSELAPMYAKIQDKFMAASNASIMFFEGG